MYSIFVKKEEEIKFINVVCLFNFCVLYFLKKNMYWIECNIDFWLNLIFDLIKCIEIDVLVLVEFR